MFSCSKFRVRGSSFNVSRSRSAFGVTDRLSLSSPVKPGKAKKNIFEIQFFKPDLIALQPKVQLASSVGCLWSLDLDASLEVEGWRLEVALTVSDRIPPRRQTGHPVQIRASSLFFIPAGQKEIGLRRKLVLNVLNEIDFCRTNRHVKTVPIAGL